MEYEGIALGLEKKDSKEILKDFYLNYRKDVFRLALSCLHNLHQADDIVQDVFLKLYKTLQKEKDIGNIKGWLYKTTIRTCLDFKKSFWNKVFSKKEEVDLPFMEEKTIFEEDVFKDLNKNLKKLPPKQRVAISLRFYKDMPIKEIAENMGISESSIKTHISRGIRKLRKIMEVKNETY